MEDTAIYNGYKTKGKCFKFDTEQSKKFLFYNKIYCVFLCSKWKQFYIIALVLIVK